MRIRIVTVGALWPLPLLQRLHRQRHTERDQTDEERDLGQRAGHIDHETQDPEQDHQGEKDTGELEHEGET